MATAQVPGLPASGGSSASDTATPETPLTKDAIHEMVARMSDDQVRAMLLDHLDAVTAQQGPAEPPQNVITRIETLWSAFLEPTSDAFRKLPVLFARQGEALGNFTARYGGLGGVLTLFGLIAATLVAGLAADFGARQLIQRWRHLDASEGEDTLWGALNYLFRRLVREMVGLFVFYVTIRIVGRALLTPEQIDFAGPFVVYLIWMPRLAAAIARFVLAPKSPKLRLVNMDDHWAGFLQRHIVGLVLLGGATIFVVTFNAKNGVPNGETRIGYWFDSAVYIYIAIIAWTARAALSGLMLGADDDDTSRFDEQVARIYPYFAIGVAAVMWVVVNILSGLGRFEQLLQGAHYVTMFWLLITPALDTAIRGLVRHLVPPMIGEGEVAERAYLATKRSYIRIGRVVVIGIVLMIISKAWDVDLFSFSGDLPGAADNLIRFLMTIVVGYVVFELFSLWVNRRLAQEHTSRAQSQDQAAGEGGGVGGSRLATVLPLLRMTGQAAIGVIFGLLALGNLGIDITPLLAGAGILGLAIGFGAQKLVADIVGGIFFLIDDAFRVGEYVDVGGTMGTVEKISIRSMQLRHHRGAVHTIPYGEIQKLTNFSRDWVIMKLMFTVPFDTDPNRVKKIFKKIGAEMMEDPVHKDGFLEPFKSQGVFDFDDVGMVIRGKFMAKPGQQFTIRKEIYNRVKKEFEAADIPFARREVRVAIPGLEDEHLGEEEKQAVAAAAATAVQQQADQEAVKK